MRDAKTALRLFYSNQLPGLGRPSYRERARTAKVLARELPFFMASGGQYWNGVIDLVLEEDEQIVGVDYKTSAEKDQLPDSYSQQAAVYTEALRRLYPAKPVRFEFWWLWDPAERRENEPAKGRGITKIFTRFFRERFLFASFRGLYLSDHMQPRTLPRLFETSVERYGDNVLISEKTDTYHGSTYRQIRDEVYQFAAGLIAKGIAKGDRIALLSEGRKDWVVAELGILYAGAVCVPLSVKIEEIRELCFRISHSGSRLVIVSANQLPKALAVQRSLPEVMLLVLDPVQDAGTVFASRNEIMTAGADYLRDNREEFNDRWQSVTESDPATISYTSGTTADPKGIILTHRNYTANVEQASQILDIPPSYRSLLILPWDHSFTHTAGVYLIIGNGASMGAVQAGRSYAESLRNIPGNIREFKPTFLFSVPTLARNFRKNIENTIKQKGKITGFLFRTGLRVAYAYNLDGQNRGKGARFLLRPLVTLFDLLVFRKVRQAFGGELKFFIGGGALLDIDLQHFFYALGIPMLQGYGLTEAAPVISANVPAKHKLGSSGRPVPDLEVTIRDDEGETLTRGQIGEIVVRGDNVMAGYWDNPRATREALRGSWLYTGDLGFLDHDGFLHVLGRKKSLLISSDGEKFSPGRDRRGADFRLAVYRPDHAPQQPVTVHGCPHSSEPGGPQRLG